MNGLHILEILWLSALAFRADGTKFADVLRYQGVVSIIPVVLNRLSKGGWLALAATLLLVPGADAFAGTVRGVSATAAAGAVVVKVDVPGGVDGVSSFALAGPDRIVVDLAGGRSGIVSGAGAAGVAKIRVGQFSADVTRLVIDLAQPMTLADVAAAADGNVLTLTLKPADTAGFARYAKAPRRTHDLTSPRAAAPVRSAESTASPAPKAHLAPAGAPVVTAPIVESPPKRTAPAPKGVAAARGQRPLVVIDAGHGGHDTGALSVWGGRREKDVTLTIAKAIKRELDDSGRVRTVLTRSDDRFLVLAERREVARRLKADLFISIHADSAGNPDASGATVYTLSEVASDREAARLAARENKSDIINGIDLGREASDVSSILIDLAQRDTMNVSSSFAALLQREMSPYVKFKNEFHRFAGFVVLKAADTPSVLIETGYLSNMDDSKFLFSSSGQKAIAKGVKNAVEAHFARRYRIR